MVKVTVSGINSYNKINEFEGYVAALAIPPWRSPTALIAVVGRDGHDIQVIAGQPAKVKEGEETAYGTLSNLEPRRVYSWKIPGTCVKRNLTSLKTGFTHAFEIRTHFAPSVLLSADAFKPTVHYNLCPFPNLMQKEVGEIVTVYGIVVSHPSVDGSSILKKGFEIQQGHSPGYFAMNTVFVSPEQLL